MTNVKTPPPPFRVDVINVWSLGTFVMKELRTAARALLRIRSATEESFVSCENSNLKKESFFEMITQKLLYFRRGT